MILEMPVVLDSALVLISTIFFSSLIFKTKYDGIMWIGKVKIQDPYVLFHGADIGTAIAPSCSGSTKVLDYLGQHLLNFVMIIRCENHPDGWLLEKVGWIRHSPMSRFR